MGKTYTYDKDISTYQCVTCDAAFETAFDIRTHVRAHRAEAGTLTPWDMHKARQCPRNPQICRYCHPVRRPKAEGEVDPAVYRQQPYTTKTAIEALLSNEGRYRNKFSTTHFAQLDRAAKKAVTLRQLIRRRLESRLREVRDDDHRQTPYVAHAVDVAQHATATCCRGCVERWHRFAKWDGNKQPLRLTDAQVQHLENVVYTFITQYVLPHGHLRAWFQELLRTNHQTEVYYKQISPFNIITK